MRLDQRRKILVCSVCVLVSSEEEAILWSNEKVRAVIITNGLLGFLMNLF